MRPSLRLELALAGGDTRMRRLLRYWGLAMLLYLLCLALLWGEVLAGAARACDAVAVTLLVVAGQVVFFGLIRFGSRFQLTPARLSEHQGRFAVICGVAGYAVIGPFRGSTLVFMLVILVFCAFTLPASRSRSLAWFAVILFGTTMLWLVVSNPQAFDAVTELKRFILVSSAIMVVGYLTGRLSELRAALKAQKSELSEALARIQELAACDELTTLPNRRSMTALLKGASGNESADENEGEPASAPAPTPGCLAILDIDHFKRINDSYGHAAGDEVLREFARQSKLLLRAQDTLARWGGEEFLLYLPGTRLETAKGVVERLRQQIASLRFTHADRHFGITCSAGVVEVESGEEMESAISRADGLLYAAKASGRNCVLTVAPRELEA